MNEVTNGFQIRFDGPPSHESGRFIEVETLDGRGMKLGEWFEDGDYWLLRVEATPWVSELLRALKKALTWEGRLNEADQAAMQDDLIQSAAVRVTVQNEMKAARALEAQIEELHR